MQLPSELPAKDEDESQEADIFNRSIVLSARTYAIVCQLLLVTLCFASYLHALNGSFVFDDTVAILKNKDVTSTPANLTAIFRHDFWGAPITDADSHKSYRPLTTLMFHVEYTHGLRPKHMKAINLLLHSVNSLLVWHLLRGLEFEEHLSLNGDQVAIIASVLFSIHPIHTEAVCGIVGRAELMFSLLYLIALLLQKGKDTLGSRTVVPAVMCLTACGMLFKETAITIPIACMFFEYMRRKVYLKDFKHQVGQLLNIENTVYTIGTVVLLWLRLQVQHFESPRFKPMDNPVASSSDPLTRILSQQYLYVLNLWIMLCPHWLSFDWALGCVELIRNMWDLRLQSVLAFYSITTVSLIYFKTSFAPLLSLGLMMIPFLPASGLIKVGFVIAERVLYVPSVGFCLLVAYGFVYTHGQATKYKWLQTQFKWMLMLLIVCLLLRTRQRAVDWQTEERLFTSALKVCPKNAKVHYNIARLATDKLDNEKAFLYYHKAIELFPHYESALMNLGNLYRESGDFVNAEKYIKTAIEVVPDFAAAWMNLGIVQSAQKKYPTALRSYETALKYRKNYAVCHYNLGNLFLDQKMFTEAMHHWHQAVAINPRQPKAWANILTMLDNRGLQEDAVRLSATALQHLPNETSITFIRANVFGKLKHYVEAEALYKRVIAIEPLNTLYHTNLGVLYHRWGKINDAIECYKRAIELNPAKTRTARENLSKLLTRVREEQLTKPSIN